MPPTMPAAATLLPLAGSMTVSRTLRTADSVTSAMVLDSPAILCRRLIAAGAAVTYMHHGMIAKAAMRHGVTAGGPGGRGRGITTAAALGAVAATAAGLGVAVAAAVEAAAVARSARGARPTWRTSSARDRSACAT